MYFNKLMQLKAAASKKQTRVVSTQNTDSIVPLITDSSNAKVTASLEAYQAKQVFDKCVPQGGDAKSFAKSKYVKSETSRRFDHTKHSQEKGAKKWSRKERAEFLKETKRNVEKKVYRNGFRPEAGLEGIPSLSQFQSFATLQGIDLPANICSKIEGVVLLCTSLAECVSTTQAMSIFLLYMKSHYSESLVKVAAEAFEELFDGGIEPQSSGEKPPWLTMLRSGLDDWRTLVTNPVFKKISYLMSLLVTIGLCDAAQFDWKIGTVKVFSAHVLEKHFTAFDLIDAAIETVMYFVEGGYECFVTKSFSPLMYSDHRAREFDLNYTKLVSTLEHVRTGNLQRMAGMDENSYAKLLHSTLEEAQSLSYTAHNSWEKKIFTDRLMALRRLKTQFDAIRVQGGLRVAPFTVNFFGKSSVGKSSVSAISMVAGLLSNGFAADDEMLVTLNEADKYMSNYKSFINGIFLDDVGNTKPDFVEKAPTNKIIEICNNVRQYANMAEAQDKGKVSIEPYMVNLTTNVKDLNAGVFSEEPVSVARRAHLTVTVEVKEQFCTTGLAGSIGQQLDASKVEAYYTDSDGFVDVPMIPDLWELTVERVVPLAHPTKNSKDIVGYEIIEHNGRKLEKCTIFQYLDCMVDFSRKHYAQQTRLVERSSNLSAKMEMCGTCKKPIQICSCSQCDIDMEEQSGYVLGAAVGHILNSKWEQYRKNFTSIFFRESAIVESIATKKLVEYTHIFENSPFFVWTNYIPTSWLSHPYGRKFVEYAMRDEIANEITREVRSNLSIVFLLVVMSLIGGLFMALICLPLALYLIYRVSVIVETVKERMYLTLKSRNDAMPEVFKRVRDAQFKYVALALGAFVGLYSLLKIWQGIRNAARQEQGSLHPTCRAEIDQRDSEVNPWVDINSEPTPKTNQAATVATMEDMQAAIERNIFYLRVKQGENWRHCNAVALQSNILMIPYHMWFDNSDMTSVRNDSLYIQLIHKNPDGGGERTMVLSWEHSCRIGDHDLTLSYAPVLGTRKSIVRFLPTGKPRSGAFRMVHRNKNGEIETFSGDTQVQKVGHRYAQFFGASYKLSSETFSGLCMSPLLQGGGGFCVVGFHLGGKPTTKLGIAGTPLHDEVKGCIAKIGGLPGVLLGVVEGTMPKETYGKPIVTTTAVDKHSPVHFLPDANLRVFGSTTGRATTHSSVEKTIISDTVEKVCGVPQKWGPPQFNPLNDKGRGQPWKPWRDSLLHSANPSMGIPGELLSLAAEDYIEPLIQLVKKDYVNTDVRPLTRMENVCGIDGLRFIDKISPKTSVGFPLSGPKKEYLTLLDPQDFPDFNYPVELDEQFWEEATRMEHAYLAGERAYPVFKACLKDEPTPLNKEKVRVFQSAPIALQLLIRKYFLPLARVMSLYPLISECAVGLNAQGPEWEEFQAFITKYGRDRILAGDYSKYDLRMPAQLTMAAFRVFIDIAKASGNYSEEDVKIMEGLATDVCYPVMAYNGTLLQLFGSNPSGQNMTVYINSIVNSLLFRAGFYDRYSKDEVERIGRGKVLNFRDVCALGTYGDDAKSSVKQGFDAFNHISFAEFLAKYDMKFTMPDKESEPTEYMHDDDADFLKRKNIYVPEVGCHFGALDENSIFKSLHATLRSKVVTREEVARSNINGALREWFAYGREVYELRRAQMAEVAAVHDLHCAEVSVDYDTAMQRWKHKYMPDQDFEPQSGVEKPLLIRSEAHAPGRAKTLQLYAHIQNVMPMKCIVTDAPLGCYDVGEVDMIFQKTYQGRSHIVLVEVKNSKMNEIKGHAQIRRAAQAYGILTPKNSILGVYYDPRGFVLVEEAGAPCLMNWDEFPFDPS